MNLKKLLIVAAVVVVCITAYKFFTRVDRSDPAAVATAFTKAIKNKDTSAASDYYVPADAQTWREKTDEKLSGMRSGAKERYYERIPETPAYGAITTVDGKSTMAAAEHGFILEMSNIDGKWYVSKTNLD